ncbi:MAG TPA: hypothetical protein V6C50_06575 [Crinalium sp.]
MVGFIKGLFGAKQPAETESTPPPEAAPKQPKPRPQAFYLDSGDARTLGDLDYMQAAREIKRSFPKTLNGEVPGSISLVSSLQRSLAQQGQEIAAKTIQAGLAASQKANFAPQTTPVSGWTAPKADSVPKVKDPKERRRNDTNLDMFRTMARDIQKSNSRKD